MADHADDTILDDELDDNEFNFDNENEDDLLADNDDWLEKSKSTVAETATNHVTEIQGLDEDKIIEQSEAEEDVLDIGVGLVLEDVDPELQDPAVPYSQTKSEPVKRISEEPIETGDKKVLNDALEPTIKDHQDEYETSRETATISNADEPATISNKTSYNSHEDDQDDDERSFKAKVVSLRKSVKKSYDDLPELAKVIPGGSTSRNNKFQRSSDTQTSRKEISSKHTYDYDDRKKRELIRPGRDRDRDRDRDHDWERDRSRDRYRDRSYDRDRSRDREREYPRSSDYRDKYYSSDDDRSPSPVDRISDILTQSYERMNVQSETHFQNVPNQYPPPGVPITQDRYNFQVVRPNMPPQPQNNMLPPNSFGPPNQVFNRPPPPQMEHMMRHPPPAAQRMPSQQMGFLPEPRMQPPPHQLGFRPPPPQMNPQMNQRFPPNLPPHLQPRGPPMHVQPSPFNGPSQPHMPPQMIRQPGPSPQMQPPFRPPGNHIRPPPQPICGPMEHMRPAPHPNMRPPLMRLPVPNEQQPPPPIMGHAPPRPVAHVNNFPPPNNVVRMTPPFRPHQPPPHNVNPRPPPYFNEQQPQFHAGAPPATSFPQGSQHMNQAPPYPSGVSGQPVQPVPVNNRPGGEMYHNAPNRAEANYPQYPQQNYAQQPARQYSEYPQYGTGNPNLPQKRISSSPNESPSKYGRYDDIPGRRESEDDEMKSYREKVEHQKRIREKYIQEKEEQRLTNQMQSFIQNNIKGILEKREKLIRKNEIEQSQQSREPSRETSRIIDSRRSDESRRNDSSDYRSRRSVSPPVRRNIETSRRSISPPRRNVEAPRRSFSPVRRNVEATRARDRDRVRDVVPKERPKTVSGRAEDNHRAPRTEKKDKYEDSVSDSERKQLHKLSRITYKDGTVALKCIPVHNNNSVSSKSNISSRKNDEDTNNSSSGRRRMVVSQQIPLPNVKNELNENMIVESVRKGVAQSSMTMAKRFSSLKAMNKNAEEDESLSLAKSKNKLVVPDEDGTRTVLVKNVSPSTTPSVLTKMINTCGSASRTKWIYNGGHAPNHVKITFCRMEDAKKFCQHFHKKTVDTSIITVSLVSDMK